MLIANYSDDKKHYIENLGVTEAEDSSYDSDCDNDDIQQQQLQLHQHQKQQQQQHHQQQQQQQNTKNLIDHEQVSRTTSDTLGQEFAEYVTTSGPQIYQQQLQNQLSSLSSTNKTQITPSPSSPLSASLSPSILQQQQQQQQQQDRSPGYQARVEFALKLGYTERLVQAALARLGPDPAQNELLAELIKLGAQHGNKSDFACDSPTAECLSPISGSTISLTSSGIIGDNIIHHSGVISNFICNDGNNSNISGNNCNNIGNNSGICNDVILSQINTLRSIVIDGSNVAMSHGNKEVFSCRGIKLCVDWFKNRGHKDITVFVPKWRKESSRPDNPIKDQDILNELERERMLVFTPSRLVGGKRMVCYDDRYILKLAVENDGIVVSNDNYRDLVQESSEFKKVVEERVLMYSFVNDRFMPPDDPLGRSGPTLDNFLRVQPKKGDPPPPCPYGKKCTYGNKCKFHHPERGLGPHKSVTERLSEHAARHLSARNSSSTIQQQQQESTRTPVQGKSLSVPLSSVTTNETGSTERLSRKALCRTRSGAPDCSNAAGITSPTSFTKIQQHSPSSQQQQQQQQQQPPTISTWGDPSSGCHVIDAHHINFPKSHSIENISREAFTHTIVGPPPPPHPSHPANFSTLWSQNIPTPPSNLSTGSGSSGGAKQQQQQSTAQSQSQKQTELLDESVNLHRKLRRQLTLNPAGCDPRIYQLQRCMTPSGTSTQPTVTPSPIIPTATSHSQSHSPHRPLAPSLSGPRPTQWDLHQSVTRIASAPDPSRPWHSGPPPASSSEPHINLWPHHTPPSILAAQDQRRRLHYHLASIFPEEQVQTVMQMYPDETNPQTICAAILNMFPKI